MRTTVLLRLATAFSKIATYRVSAPAEGELGWLAQELADLVAIFPAPEIKRALNHLRQVNFPPAARMTRAQAARATEFLDGINSLLADAHKRSVREANVNARIQIKRLRTLLDRARTELTAGPKAFSERGPKEQSEALMERPRRERAAPREFLYHGTYPDGAYSMLSSGTARGSQTYNKLSLTTDPTLAASFGDVVFAFDAPTLQRMGARKMGYLPEKQLDILKKKVPGRLEEDPKSPRIYEKFRYEQEWVMKVPFPLEPALKQVIVFQDDPEDAERIQAILEEVSPVPVMLRLVPTHSPFSFSGSVAADLGMRKPLALLDELTHSSWWPFHRAIHQVNQELEQEDLADTDFESPEAKQRNVLRQALRGAMRAVSGMNSLYGAEDPDPEALQVLATAFETLLRARNVLEATPGGERARTAIDWMDAILAGREKVMSVAKRTVQEAGLEARQGTG